MVNICAGVAVSGLQPRTEKALRAELQKLPTLHDIQSVTIRPYSDRIEPEAGPTQIKFVDVATVVARLQQQYDLDLTNT